MSILVQTCHPYTGNLNSEKSVESKEGFADCEDVLVCLLDGVNAPADCCAAHMLSVTAPNVLHICTVPLLADVSDLS